MEINRTAKFSQILNSDPIPYFYSKLCWIPSLLNVCCVEEGMGVLQETTKALGVTPYAWGLVMAKEDDTDKATTPHTFFLCEFF